MTLERFWNIFTYYPSTMRVFNKEHDLIFSYDKTDFHKKNTLNVLNELLNGELANAMVLFPQTFVTEDMFYIVLDR